MIPIMSSAGQGLTHCNHCGWCCETPCLIQNEADIERMAAFLGKPPKDVLLGLFVFQDPAGNIMVRPQKKNGRCEYHIDGRCSIHEAKPSGGADFECWTPETNTQERMAKFVWSKAELQACAEKFMRYG